MIANAQEGEISSEMVGLAIAALVLLLTFGSIVAAGLPLATALFGLGISSALIGLLAAVIDVPDWAPALASMLGHRRRDRLRAADRHALPRRARRRARSRARRSSRRSRPPGRSVLIAGTTVVISLLGLFLMGLPYLYGAALATIVAVLVVMAASVTLVPALLAIAGRRIDRLRIPGTGRAGGRPDATPAARWGRAVQRRPWVAAIAGVAVLLVLASPFAGLRLGFPDGGNDAADTTTRQAYDLVSQGFGPGANGPLLLVAPTDGPRRPRGDGRARRRAARRAGRRGGRARRAASPRGDATVLTVIPRTSPQDAATEDLIHHLRDDVLPGAGAAGRARRRDRRVHRPEPGDGRPAAAVHRRRRRARRSCCCSSASARS